MVGSDHSRSQTSLNTIDPPTVTKQQQSNKMDGIEINNQFVSMQSISSTASSMSNNENMDRHHKKSSNKHNQIYDSLNNHNQKKSSNKNRQQLTLKDLNAADDTATETESLISAFDDMRMIQQHQQQQHKHHNNHKMNGKRSSSSASSKPTHLSSFSKLLFLFRNSFSKLTNLI